MFFGHCGKLRQPHGGVLLVRVVYIWPGEYLKSGDVVHSAATAAGADSGGGGGGSGGGSAGAGAGASFGARVGVGGDTSFYTRLATGGSYLTEMCRGSA